MLTVLCNSFLHSCCCVARNQRGIALLYADIYASSSLFHIVNVNVTSCLALNLDTRGRWNTPLHRFKCGCCHSVVNMSFTCHGASFCLFVNKQRRDRGPLCVIIAESVFPLKSLGMLSCCDSCPFFFLAGGRWTAEEKGDLCGRPALFCLGELAHEGRGSEHPCPGTLRALLCHWSHHWQAGPVETRTDRAQ